MKDLLNEFIKKRNDEANGVTLILSSSIEKFISYKILYIKALNFLSYFQKMGIKEGDELLFQIENIEKFLYIFWACQLGNITAVPIDVGENEENHLKIFRIWKTLLSPFYLAEKDTVKQLKKHSKENFEEYDSMLNKYIDVDEADKIHDKNISMSERKVEGIALIQFSSGSTGIPKGIPIKYMSLSTHVNDLAIREEVTPNDVLLNWAPLSHNLGLISVHLVGVLIGLNQFMMSKRLFVKEPLLWIEKASEHKATMIYAPNFGYKYVLTAMNSEKNYDWDLSTIRIAFNGAEPINYELCKEFEKTMNAYGIKENVFYPAYGCSEATSVISIPKVGSKLKKYSINRNHMNFEEKVILCDESDSNCVNIVAVGEAVSNCEVRVCNTNNLVLEDFIIGNLQVRGKNIIDSYYNNLEATNEAFIGEGWFNTGDLCFKDNETIVITGRAKEIIFINGQNYYPNDIERVIEKVDKQFIGKIACCGIFSKDIQTDKVYVFFETEDLKDESSLLDLSKKIKSCVSNELGLYMGEVIPIQNLEKTDSGKLQRLKMQKKFINGEYDICFKQNRFECKEKDKDVEKNVLCFWKEVLNDDEITINDNFFDLGGSSSMLILLTSKIEELYPNCITAIDIFEASTVHELSELITMRLEGNDL